MMTFKLILNQISMFTIPVIFVLIIGYAMIKRAKVYESFVTGGKEGFDIFIRILPYLVAIFVAIGTFRVSGGLDFLSECLAPLTLKIGMPPEVLPVALMRPLSGSGRPRIRSGRRPRKPLARLPTRSSPLRIFVEFRKKPGSRCAFHRRPRKTASSGWPAAFGTSWTWAKRSSSITLSW